MKKMHKRLFSLALAILMALPLAGCGHGTSSSGTPGTDTSAPPKDGAVSGTLEIQYFVGGYGSDWWEWLVEAFEDEYPEVEVVVNAGSDINETMTTRWISENPPDLVYLDGPSVSETTFVEDGQLLDLTDWYQNLTMEDGSLLKDNFLVDPSNYGGKVYALPIIYDNRCVWYDAAEFASRGWMVPSDFDSWISVMKQIKSETGVSPLGSTGVYPSVFMKGVMYPAFADAGGKDFLMSVIDGEEGAWSSPECLSVMKKLQEIVDAGLVDPNFAGETHTESQMSFLNHKNYFVATGFWLPNEMKGSIPDGFEFGMIPTPMNDTGKPACTIPDIKSVGIAQGAKNPAAAKAFLAFMFSPESAVKMAEMAGTSLNLKNIDYSGSSSVPSYLLTATEMLADASRCEIISIDHAMSTDLQNPIGDVINLLLMGEIDAEEFCRQAEDIAEFYRSNK
ncbi:MAG: extracellular solute-binding protein [Lawsonibacter sp.]|nr:extracellular solute-binding protein [Lawsonibacter sp.]